MTAPALLTEAEAAEALRLCQRTLRKARKEGRLSYVLIGRAVRYTMDDIATFTQRHAMIDKPAPVRPPLPAKHAGKGVVVPFSQRSR